MGEEECLSWWTSCTCTMFGLRFAAGLVVAAALVGEAMKQLAPAETIRPLQGASVEAHSLVPGVNGRVVAIDAILVAIVQSVLVLTNDVHENMHVRRSLLDELLHPIIRGSGEVSIAIRKLGLGLEKGGLHPVVGVVVPTVVVVEVLEVSPM